MTRHGVFVRLIRIRTLAAAGVPLARVRQLLDADPDTFAAATTQIDRQLRAQIRLLQEHRRRIAQLGTGDSLALPAEVVHYLDRLMLPLRTSAPPPRQQVERSGSDIGQRSGKPQSSGVPYDLDLKIARAQALHVG